MVDFHFPWLPSRCNHCDKWGHGKNVCVMNRKDKEMTTRSSSSTTKQATEDLSITQDTEGTMKKDGILGINEEVEIEKVEKEVEDGRDEET